MGNKFILRGVVFLSAFSPFGAEFLDLRKSRPFAVVTVKYCFLFAVLRLRRRQAAAYRFNTQ